MDFSLNHFVRTVTQDFSPSSFSPVGSVKMSMESLGASQQGWPFVDQFSGSVGN